MDDLKVTAKKGLSIRRNAKNKLISIGLHYTADEDKDPDTEKGKIWYDSERPKWSKKRWETDFEMSRQIYGGTAVFSRLFNTEEHVFEPHDFELDPDSPILLCWDFGGNQSVSFMQYRDDRLFIFDEIPNAGQATREVAPMVAEYYIENYSDCLPVHIPDPSGFDKGRNDVGGKSNVDALEDIFTEYGLPFVVKNLTHKFNKIGPRVDAVLDLMSRNNDKGEPRFNICKEMCPMAVMGFQGSYQWDSKAGKKLKKGGIVDNEFTHIVDTIQYGAVFVTSTAGQKYLKQGSAYRKWIRPYEIQAKRKPTYQL